MHHERLRFAHLQEMSEREPFRLVVLRRRDARPVQPARLELLSGVAEEFQEVIVDRDCAPGGYVEDREANDAGVEDSLEARQ